jgi:hypothetical protein
MLSEIKEINERQEKENEKQQERYDSMYKNMNPSSMMRNAQASMPKMSMPSMSIPKI